MKRLILAAAVVATGCGQHPTPPTREQAELSACRAALRATLIDPESAQFSEERLSSATPERVYALTLNARNRLGGYVGRQARLCWVVDGRVTELS